MEDVATKDSYGFGLIRALLVVISTGGPLSGPERRHEAKRRASKSNLVADYTYANSRPDVSTPLRFARHDRPRTIFSQSVSELRTRHPGVRPLRSRTRMECTSAKSGTVEVALEKAIVRRSTGWVQLRRRGRHTHGRLLCLSSRPEAAGRSGEIWTRMEGVPRPGPDASAALGMTSPFEAVCHKVWSHPDNMLHTLPLR
jgi:hypothetical protein